MNCRDFLGAVAISFFGLIVGASQSAAGLGTLVQIPMRWVPELNPDLILANGFAPHHGFQGTGFRIEPIHRNLSSIDYAAWHDESWNDLTTLFGKAWGWPREMTEAQNADDLENLHYKRFLTQEMISYEILSLDGERAYGSIYIVPGKCGIYEAEAAGIVSRLVETFQLSGSGHVV